MGTFAVIPIEAFQDKRLNLWHLRVLGSLYSFRGKSSEVFPSRESIAARCGGLHVANVSRVTTELERFGWLTKTGKGGYSKASHYVLTIPETLAESTTVPEHTTLAESTTVRPATTVVDSVTTTLAESTTRKELNQEETSARRPVKRKMLTLAEFVADCQAMGAKVIPEEDEVFEFAEKAQIEIEMIRAAWIAFKAYWNTAGERKRDWRRAFRDAVKKNRDGIWFIREGQPAQWTTVGEGYRRQAA